MCVRTVPRCVLAISTSVRVRPPPFFFQMRSFWQFTWSSLRASFSVIFCPILKTNTPSQRSCNQLNEDNFLTIIQQEMAPWKSSKFLDALTSRAIGRDECDSGQSVGCSVAIVTRYDFDCVHEMKFLTKRRNQKSRRKRKEHLKRS